MASSSEHLAVTRVRPPLDVELLHLSEYGASTWPCPLVTLIHMATHIPRTPHIWKPFDTLVPIPCTE